MGRVGGELGSETSSSECVRPNTRESESRGRPPWSSSPTSWPGPGETDRMQADEWNDGMEVQNLETGQSTQFGDTSLHDGIHARELCPLPSPTSRIPLRNRQPININPRPNLHCTSVRTPPSAPWTTPPPHRPPLLRSGKGQRINSRTFINICTSGRLFLMGMY